MAEFFGNLPDGGAAYLYTISCGELTAKITNYGAALVSLLVPDRTGQVDDVVLGCDDVSGYNNYSFMGATVGRNSNRIKNACFVLENRTYSLPNFFGPHNLHSGPDVFHRRLWEADQVSDSSVTFLLHSPDGDQGFPGNAEIRVTYTLEYPSTLTISYDASCDCVSVFNMTNHSFFNLAGHQNSDLAMDQTLMLPARYYTACDLLNLPTGKMRSVKNTPLDFRIPKPLGKDIRGFFRGYDHNFEVFCNPCAVLHDPHSGRTMSVTTDCPGVQVYTPGGVRNLGKGGIQYGKYPAVCLETQFYPDAVNHPQWAQPFFKDYHSQTSFRFSW